MTRWPYGRWWVAARNSGADGPNRSKCPGRTFARFCILFSAARQGGAPNSAPPPWPPGQPGWGAARGAPRNGHGRASARLPPSLRHHAVAMPPPLALAHGTLKRAPPRGPRLTVRGVGVPPWRPPRGNNDARVGRVGGWPFPEGKCVLGYTPGKGMQPWACTSEKNYAARPRPRDTKCPGGQ